MSGLGYFSSYLGGLEPIKKVVEPSTRLMWPELQDDHLENSRKVPLDRHDIIIDKVSILLKLP